MADLFFAPQGIAAATPLGGVGAGFLQAGLSVGRAIFDGPLADNDDSIFLNLLQQAQSEEILGSLPDEATLLPPGSSQTDPDRTVIEGTAEEIASAQEAVQNVLLRFVDSSGNLPPGFDLSLIPEFVITDEVATLPPEIDPTVEILPVGSVVEIPDVGEPDFIPDPGTPAVVTTSPQPGGPTVTTGGFSVADLSGIGNILAGVSGIIGSLDGDPSTPGIFGGAVGPSLPDIIGSVANIFDGSTGTATVPAPVDLTPTPDIDESTGVGAVAGTAVVTRRDASVAARLGLTPQQVAQARILCKAIGRRRRRRMLTKSDVADISTMAALLGKNSESFKVWLAKATRS